MHASIELFLNANDYVMLLWDINAANEQKPSKKRKENKKEKERAFQRPL